MQETNSIKGMHIEAAIPHSIAKFHCHCFQSLLDDFKHGETLCHATKDTGLTPLHIASGSGDLESVSILLNHGAHADAQNDDLETPMHLAAGRGLQR